MRKAKPPKRLCFDIETELFTNDFRHARDFKDRLKHAPKMRIACTFDGERWMYFLPSEADALIALLVAADELITFNGKMFDELVLRRHHGLVGSLPGRGKHIDLFEAISDKENRRVGLHRLAQLNLGESKHTEGRSIAKLDLDGLKAACRSDVSQTYRLWELWRDGSLRIPEQRTRAEPDDPFDAGPGHHMPQICPGCHSVATLIFIPYDFDEMSEGQQADYMAGVSGTAYCEACGADCDWGM
jgi:RNase_H superfamily